MQVTGNDTVSYYGSESSIDGGIRHRTRCILRKLPRRSISAIADQTTGDSTHRCQFPERRRVGASVHRRFTIAGSSGCEHSITGGSGADTIDGAGGADIIAAGVAATIRSPITRTETSIDGGSGTDLVVFAATGGITAINLSVAAGADQTTGDSVSVANFESINASIFTTALTVIGSSVANTITTGSGNDTIDGGGGADAISAGGGNDTVSYYGTETLVDGGTGTNTLILNTAVVLNLANANQLSFGAGTISNFQNVDASAVSSAVSITGSSGANTITGGAGNDIIDGAGGADVIAAGGGNDTVSYYASEVSIDGGTGTNTLVMRAAGTVNLGNADQTSGDSTNVTGFHNVDGSAVSSALSLTGSTGANTITGGAG